MLTRVFNVAGLVVQIAEWKAYLLASSAKQSATRSAIAMLSVHIGVLVALAGFAVLIGAGFVALEAVVGVAAALAAVGVGLLIIAFIMLAIVHARSKAGDDAMTDREARMKIERGKQQLRSMLGMTEDEGQPGGKPGGASIPSSSQADSVKGLDDPKVAMAAGFALLGLLGPSRLFSTVRIASTLASVTALANHAIAEHRNQQGPSRSP